MSFNLNEFKHIVSTIDDLLSMSEPQSFLNISTDCEREEDWDEEKDDVNNNRTFINLTFFLKNGTSSIRLYDATGVFFYMDRNGDILKNIEFNDINITLTDGSFKKALKQIRAFDRQHTNTSNIINAKIDRASFGLAEVN
jgi:hypothetical protein